MESKSTTTADFFDKIRDVTESLKDEFNLTNNPEENDYINTGPPPNMKRRKLIFDSMRTIIERDAGSASGGGAGVSSSDNAEDRGRYVYVFGAGYHGQLGRKAARGHKKYANIPIGVHLPSSIAVRQISCGALHTAVVTDGGLIYSWGDGRMGQLGHLQEGFSNQPVPTLVSSLSGVSIRHIACGQNHTMCITNDGKVYSWGWAKYGQLGLGTRTNQRYPVQISDEAFNNKTICQISCGDRHSAAITTNGEIFTFGSGEHGQLGHGNDGDCFVPKLVESLQHKHIKYAACGSIHTAIVSDDGKLYIFGFGENLYGKQAGNFNYSPILIPFRSTIQTVACGQSHILILCTNGDVYAWGDGSYGEIGQGAFKASQSPRLVLLNKNIASIACGRYHSAAVTKNGSLYTWGCGDNGQLGRPQNINNDNMNKKATSIPKLVISLLGNVIGEISCGEHHTCVLASCRYKNLSDDTFEYGKLEEIEFQSKLNLISSSKQKGRGIAKKDLIKIKKWRKDEEQRIVKKKKFNQLSENKKIQQEIDKIATRKEIILSSPSKQLQQQKQSNTVSPKQSNNETPQKMQSSPSKMRKQQQQQSKMNDSSSLNITERANNDNEQNKEMQPMKDDDASSKRITAKVANANRASFHETSRNFLYGMASQIFGGSVEEDQESESTAVCNASTKRRESKKVLTADVVIKNKFHARKEYDKLKLITKRKELQLRKLDEDLAILHEVDDCSEIASQDAEFQSRKLGMKLNTVMIKISEAERSKRTYELNIVHIKDESQENHKQLDSLRRNLFLQQNLKKKIAKFRDYALNQKEFAVMGLKEFNAELAEWRNFLDYQYRHLASMAKKDEEAPNSNKENKAIKACDIQKNEKKAKKQQKAQNRIKKLEKLCEQNAAEQSELNEKLLGYEESIKFFEERFKRIYNATGLAETGKIINKFFVNKEINNEQSKLLEELYEKLAKTEAEASALENELKVLHNNNNDHTWREIDGLQEKLQKAKSNLVQEKSQTEKINLEFTLFAEWINVIQNNLLRQLKNYKIDDEMHAIQQRAEKKECEPKQLVESLAEYIEIMLNIIKDIEDKTFAIKRKQPSMRYENEQDVEDENEQNQNNLSIANKSNKLKKKTRKSKR